MGYNLAPLINLTRVSTPESCTSRPSASVGIGTLAYAVEQLGFPVKSLTALIPRCGVDRSNALLDLLLKSFWGYSLNLGRGTSGISQPLNDFGRIKNVHSIAEARLAEYDAAGMILRRVAFSEGVRINAWNLSAMAYYFGSAVHYAPNFVRVSKPPIVRIVDAPAVPSSPPTALPAASMRASGRGCSSPLVPFCKIEARKGEGTD